LADARRPLLVVFGGLPGTGKTTIAQAVARQTAGVYLRIDVIEYALWLAMGRPEDIGEAGYAIAYAVARSNLGLGRLVIADSVNPIAATRQAWRAAAADAAATCLQVEVVCSDEAEHRRRVESRRIDIPMTPPTWDSVVRRTYEPWPEADLTLDTAQVDADEAARRVLAAIGATSRPT
jgi:predicted kinase